MATNSENWMSYIIMQDYSFYPLEDTKFEPDNKLFENRCFFFANVSNDLKCLIQFNPFELENPLD